MNAQLKRLKSGQYVRPIKLKPQKATRYDISERLFRIWRQTATVAGRQRFRFLADFLKLYFTPEEIRSLYSSHEKCLLGIAGLPREEVVKHVEDSSIFKLRAGMTSDTEHSPIVWTGCSKSANCVGRRKKRSTSPRSRFGEVTK